MLSVAIVNFSNEISNQTVDVHKTSTVLPLWGPSARPLMAVLMSPAAVSFRVFVALAGADWRRVVA